jgi:hypothetical protein
MHLHRPDRAGNIGTILRLATALAAALAGYCTSAASAPPRGIGTLAREMSPPVSRCLIQREPALVDAWLRTLPGSPEEERLVRRAEPRFPACFDPYAQTNRGDRVPQYRIANMRAALVRALLQARRADLPADPPPATGAPWYPVPDGPQVPPASASAIVAADLGSCLARKHWSDVLKLIDAVDPKVENAEFLVTWRAESARTREAAAVDSALGRVIPSIAGCFPAGAKLRIDRARLRSLLEEAAYHMTDGDRSPSG